AWRAHTRERAGPRSVAPIRRHDGQDRPSREQGSRAHHHRRGHDMSIELLKGFESKLKGKMIRIPANLCNKQTEGIVVPFSVSEVCTVNDVAPISSGWK